MQKHYTKIDDKTIYQWMISELRYAFPRDNHLAPWSCCEHIKRYLPEMAKEWQEPTAQQLIEEIIEHLRMPSFGGAKKHKIEYKQPNGAIRVGYISDYKYQEYENGRRERTESYQLDLTACKIDDNITFENTDEWLGLLSFLTKYVPEDYIPWNDKTGLFFKVTE